MKPTSRPKMVQKLSLEEKFYGISPLLCNGGTNPTRLLQSLLHREVLYNTSIIIIVVIITIATRLCVMVDTAIIMIMIIVGRDRTGRG